MGTAEEIINISINAQTPSYPTLDPMVQNRTNNNQVGIGSAYINKPGKLNSKYYPYMYECVSIIT